MFTNLLLYRSLTYTQKAVEALNAVGIAGMIARVPRSVSAEGCSHGVRLAQRDLLRALEQLKKRNMEPMKIFVTTGDGNFEEVRI